MNETNTKTYYLMFNEISKSTNYEYYKINYHFSIILANKNDDILKVEIPNFKNWSSISFRAFQINKDLYNFLLIKHAIINCNQRNKTYDLNYFDLSNEDIIYMKLMDWIK